MPVDGPALGADVERLEGLDFAPAELAVGDEVGVVLLLFVPGQVREVDALPRLVLDELDVFAAVGAGWVVAPPFGHALQAELVAAG